MLPGLVGILSDQAGIELSQLRPRDQERPRWDKMGIGLIRIRIKITKVYDIARAQDKTSTLKLRPEENSKHGIESFGGGKFFVNSTVMFKTNYLHLMPVI